MQHLFSSFWPISLCMTDSRSIHVSTNDPVLFLLWLQFSMSTISTERPWQTISPKISETSLHFVFNFPERLNKKKGNECNDFPSRLYFRTQTLRNSPQGSTWVRTSFFFFFQSYSLCRPFSQNEKKNVDSTHASFTTDSILCNHKVGPQ